MLQTWQDDILEAVHTIVGGVLDPESVILANAALFQLMKSPVWRCEFPGVQLIVHNDRSGYSYVSLPEYSDPHSDKLLIRPAMNINVCSYLYEWPDYVDDGDEFVEPLPYDSAASRTVCDEVPPLALLPAINSLLRRDPYYRMLLEDDPVQRKLDQVAQSKLVFEVYPRMSMIQLNQLTHMDSHSGNMACSVWGHRYTNFLENRIHIIARNGLGPVGIISLFDNGGECISDPKKDLLSISYISVSPAYRRSGVATELMKQAFSYCMEHEKMLERTAPTEIGLKTADFFTRLAAFEQPDLPFIRHDETRLLWALRHQSSFDKLTFADKCRFMQQLLQCSREHPSDGFFITNPMVEETLKTLCHKIELTVANQGQSHQVLGEVTSSISQNWVDGNRRKPSYRGALAVGCIAE